ncbi:MAG: threonine synthase [Bacteroidota bacterium]
MTKKLISTLTGIEYPFERIEEFADNGESLEVKTENTDKAKIRKGEKLFQRYAEFLPFESLNEENSLGEGNTCLLKAEQRLAEYAGISNLFLKNETLNPTWSFKDRGSFACMLMSKEMGEETTATISTGNMGNSIAAYAARFGIKAFVFVPEFASKEKIMAMSIHGAHVIKVKAPDYSKMKKQILSMAKDLKLRIVSGNGPIRVEGYKLAAFELYEQFHGKVPDYIAVPTSACGHIRGIFKGFRELKEAGYIQTLPKMIVVQAENNAPIVKAIQEGKEDVIPFENFHTIAEAITTGNPMGGKEIVHKAKKYNWLAEAVSEEEIKEAHQRLAQSGLFVEPASATTLQAVKKLKTQGKIKNNAHVVLMLTGSGLKDVSVFNEYDFETDEVPLNKLKKHLINRI